MGTHDHRRPTVGRKRGGVIPSLLQNNTVVRYMYLRFFRSRPISSSLAPHNRLLHSLLFFSAVDSVPSSAPSSNAFVFARPIFCLLLSPVFCYSGRREPRRFRTSRKIKLCAEGHGSWLTTPLILHAAGLALDETGRAFPGSNR